jgi:short subunit dehydrogenase-like uncharacterized protein
MSNSRFLLYGANGYTGQLIARLAADYGLKPILAGRNENAIRPLAESLQCSWLVFDLEDTAALEAALKQTPVILHAAGPFSDTAMPVMKACLTTGTHYLDITGEIGIFEQAKQFNTAAKAANIMLMPGVGFDVVPTDCLALLLKKRLPDASSLELAFATLGGGLSHGTATTMAGRLGESGAVRKDGKIIPQALGQKGMTVDFGEKELFVMSIPWGDISTAYHTTGIPNIQTYTGIAPKTYRLLKLQFLFNWLLRTSFIRNYAKKKINQRPAGPSDDKRARSKSLVWGRVQNSAGQEAIARLSVKDGYTLTAHTSLLIVKKVLEGSFTTGYQTPASVYGEDLIMEVPGSSREIVV